MIFTVPEFAPIPTYLSESSMVLSKKSITIDFSEFKLSSIIELYANVIGGG